jgi:hypothetical protein
MSRRRRDHARDSIAYLCQQCRETSVLHKNTHKIQQSTGILTGRWLANFMRTLSQVIFSYLLHCPTKRFLVSRQFAEGLTLKRHC